MNQNPNPEPDSTAEVALKRRLVNRIVIAALVVVGLLGSLVMFDAIYTPGHPVPVKRSTALKGEPAVQPKPGSAAVAKTGDAAVSEPAAAPGAPAGESQYVLQMGVFGNVANAEELRAKLERQGMPSTISIEARVTIGPFRTQEGVDAARAKLKELGLDGGLLVTTPK